MVVVSLAASHVGAQDQTRTLLDQAIAAAGGRAALQRHRAMAWHGVATIAAGPRTVRIEGDWSVEPPDRARRLVRLVTTIADPASTRDVREELRFSGSIQSNGVRWPRRIQILQDGAPFFDLEIARFTAMTTLDASNYSGHWQ